MSGPGPGPAGRDVEVIIECTTHPRERFGTPHRVTIHGDWTVTTPHDLDAERVARSFGGWCACLHFAERIVPAYREALLLMREPRTSLRRERHWQNSPSAHCRAADHLHDALEPAVRHELSPAHVAGQFGADRWRLGGTDLLAQQHYSDLMAAGGRVWVDAADPRIVEEAVDGHAQLWAAGILPFQTKAIADSLLREVLPLPVRFYRHAHLGEVDSGWLSQIVGLFPVRAFAVWAAEQGERWRLIDVDAVHRMQRLGLSAHQAIGTLDAAVAVDSLADLTHALGGRSSTAAWWLTAWARSGVTPTSDHYRLLERTHSLDSRPSPRMLDSLCRSLRRFGPDAPTRTEAAMMLALTPDVGRIEQAVRRGVRTATDPRFLTFIQIRSAR